MKKFNINDNIYIEIMDLGWDYLSRTVGYGYIEACIMPNQIKINDILYYKLQCHQVFELFPQVEMPLLFKPTILIDEKDLTNLN